MKKTPFVLLVLLVTGVFALLSGCKKDDATTDTPAFNNSGPVYPVSVTVLGPAGNPQGGASISLVNAPSDSAIFKGTTDSAGKGTIYSPTGLHTILAKMGSVWQATIDVNVQALPTGNNAGQVKLRQNTTLGKVLVVFAGCEYLEQILRDTAIQYTLYDSTTVSNLVTRSNTDTTALLTYLKQYSIIFSDCDCGSEYAYTNLARTYAKYVTQGGKIYGGHYNYYHLQKIFPPYYTTSATAGRDTLKIVDVNLSTAVGYTMIKFPSSFSGYSNWSNIPLSNVTVYAVEGSGLPAIPVIIENRLGTGKFVWTVYHNQDILYSTDSARLVRIVRYFLYNM
jgi:hypothetical protein